MNEAFNQKQIHYTDLYKKLYAYAQSLFLNWIKYHVRSFFRYFRLNCFVSIPIESEFK